MSTHEELIAEARKLSDRVEAAVDSIKNPFSATSREQERTVIAAAELLGPLADALESASLPRQVQTVEELDALPVGAIIRDSITEDLYKKLSSSYWRWLDWTHLTRRDEMQFPALVLFTPPSGETVAN